MKSTTPDASRKKSADLPLSCPSRPCLDSRQLFQNGLRLVEIIHGEVRYSLRLTQANKLILTK
ncbi:MAG: hemin uptake protein HemP [Zoogloeaceae bacterium]|nr:hemin uptake protein HemP [Zoogloeaceae bacterium]